jgi:hypothetical protein
MDIGHWIFPEEFNIDEWFGFIYRIVECDTGKEYIGKKQFHQYLRKTVKGKKNKKRIKKESEWKSYTGSSELLNQCISSKGKENYLFYIESLHKTRGSLVYEEVRKQIFEDVLRAKLPNQSTPKYFNRHIGAIKFIPPEEHSEETRLKISNSLTERYKNNPHWRALLSSDEMKKLNELYYSGESHYLHRLMNDEERETFLNMYSRGKNNPQYGKEPYNKNKKYEGLFGEEKSIQIKKILREKCPKRGDENGMFGKKHTEETKLKWKNDKRRIHRGEKNGMFNKPCFYKMTEEEIDAWKQNISKSSKGKPKPDGFGEKLSQASKGHKKKTATCVYCKKTGGAANMKRYHFENCKFKPTD